MLATPDITVSLLSSTILGTQCADASLRKLQSIEMFVQMIFFFTLMWTLEAEWVEIPQQHYVKPGRSPDTPGHAAAKQGTLQTSTPRNKNTNPTSKHRDTTTTERIHETSAKRVSSNTSANTHRVKANVLRVPATVARVEHVKKPAKDNKHSSASKSVVVKSSEESPSSLLTNKKNTFNSKEHDSELGLEIYELTLPKEKTETTTRTVVARKPLVNKGSNRIYLYSTPEPEQIKATTEKVKIVSQTDKASKPNKIRGGHQNTDKRNNIKSINETLKSVNSIEDISAGSRTPSGINPFLNKNSNRRIYIHGSSEENVHSMAAKTEPTHTHAVKISHNIGVKVSSKGSNPKNRTRGHPRTTTESPGHYTTVKSVRPHVPNRIYINQIVKSQDVKHSSTTNVPAVFRPHRDKHKSTTESTEVHSIKETNIPTKDLSTELSDESDKSQSKEVKTNPKVIKKNDFDMKNVKRVEKLPTNRQKDDIKVVSVESEDSDIVDLTPLDTPIRRIDISSITSPDDPEFITKQEFVDEDDAKHMYKDYEEEKPIIPVIDRVGSGSSSAQYDEVSVEHFEDVIIDPPKLTHFYDTYEQHTEKNKDDPENIPKTITNPKDNIANNDKHTVPSEEKQPRPIENVIKFMKVVSDTISKNTHRSIKSKMRYLEDLRDTLLMNIEHRIDLAWPDGAEAGAGARGRRSARGHVEFPSSEGALMSISFLTFAVFLIKLVLQVIHTYKNKAMMMTPAVVAISRAAAAFRKP